MGSNWKKAPPENIDFFDKVLVNHPEVEKRKMFGYPCAFLRGNMFFGLFDDSFFLRLPEEDRTTINSLHLATPFEPLPGRVMKEYVALSTEAISEKGIFQTWFEKSIGFTLSLPLKPKKAGKK
jgi:TfoX/Sxy family transcriptional regulator of competence genes